MGGEVGGRFDFFLSVPLISCFSRSVSCICSVLSLRKETSRYTDGKCDSARFILLHLLLSPRYKLPVATHTQEHQWTNPKEGDGRKEKKFFVLQFFLLLLLFPVLPRTIFHQMHQHRKQSRFLSYSLAVFLMWFSSFHTNTHSIHSANGTAQKRERRK